MSRKCSRYFCLSDIRHGERRKLNDAGIGGSSFRPHLLA